MPEAKRKWTSAELVNLLRKRFDDTRRFTVLEQVANGTGFSRDRSWIDAVVMSLWPSDGLCRDAYEVKISRADFLREIKDPTKNAWCRTHFHSFWYIAPDDCIKEQELPEGAGWLKPRGDNLIIGRAASRKESPQLDDGLLAALVRSTKKEETADDRRQREEFFRTDAAYVIAKRYKEAAVAFLTKRGEHRYQLDTDQAAISSALERAGTSEEGAKIRAQVNSVLDQFKGRMSETFERFCEIAHISLTECDAAGRFVLQSYGGEEQRDLARSRHQRKLQDEAEKRDEVNRALMKDSVSNAAADRANPTPSFATDLFGPENPLVPNARPDVHHRSPRGEVEPRPPAGFTDAEPVDDPPPVIDAADAALLLEAAKSLDEIGGELAEEMARDIRTVTKPLTEVQNPALCRQCGLPFRSCPCPPE